MDTGLFPYEKADSILTPGEREFDRVLRRVVGDRWMILMKVRLEDIARVPEGTADRYKYRNRVKSYHVDFLLCTTDNASPVLAIELDDSTHNYADVRERDVKKEAVLAAAGLPLLRVRWQPSYDEHLLEHAIREKLAGHTPQAPVYSPPPSTYAPTPRTFASPARYSRSPSYTRRRSVRPRSTFELIKGLFLLALAIVLLYGAFTGALNGVFRAGLTSLVPARLATPTSPAVALGAPTLPSGSEASGGSPAANITAVVDAASLNMRSGPGTNYPSLGTFPRGTQLEVLGKDPTGTWLQVQHPAGSTGWMSARFLKLSIPLNSVPVIAVTSP